MTSSYNSLGQMVTTPQLQSRIKYALGVAAAAVYNETAVASIAVPSGSVLTFIAVPAGVVPGNPIYDITNPVAIPSGMTVTGTTGTTVTMSGSVAGSGVGKLDVIAFVANHAKRAAFASQVASGNYNLLDICYAVLGNAAIAAEANYAVQPDFAIPDTDIQFSVNSLWNLFAGA